MVCRCKYGFQSSLFSIEETIYLKVQQQRVQKICSNHLMNIKSCTCCKLDRHYVRFVQYLQNIKYYQRDIYWYVCLSFETPNFKPLNRSITRMLKLYINLNVLRSLIFFNMPIGVCFWTLGNQY